MSTSAERLLQLKISDHNAQLCPQSHVEKTKVRTAGFLFYYGDDGKVNGDIITLKNDDSPWNNDVQLTLRTEKVYYQDYCTKKAPLCDKADRMLYLFDTSAPHFSQEISVVVQKLRQAAEQG